MKIKYIYVIEYDGQISREGYDTFDKALQHLKKQGYFYQDKYSPWKYADPCNNEAIIKDIQII